MDFISGVTRWQVEAAISDPSVPVKEVHRWTALIRALNSGWAGLSPNLKGAGYVSLGAALLIVMASMVKQLSQTLPTLEIQFVRFGMGLLILVPVLWRLGFRRLKTTKIRLHATRGFIGFLANTCLYFALANMAIADAITIQFSRPLVMVVIAVLILKHVVGWQRALVAAVGFVGIMLITRPFGDGFQPWALVALTGTIFASSVVFVIKELTRTEETMVIMFYFALFTTLFSAIPAAIVWQTPTSWEFVLLFTAGLIGITGQSLFTQGLRLGETTFVMPFDYMRIVYSFVIGIIWFSEIPGLWSYLGSALIVVSSFYLIRTERVGKQNADEQAQAVNSSRR